MWPTLLVTFTIVAFIVVGIALFFRTLIKVRWLKQHGTRIIARVTDSLFSAGPGGGQSKLVVAEWTDPRTQTVYTFRSLVPSPMRVKLGESVDVLIDPENPKHYTVTSLESISLLKR